MSFKLLNFICEEEASQILIAELSAVGFDVFEEREEGFVTSIEIQQYKEADLLAIIERYQPLFSLQWEAKEVEKVNWNEEWEKNYEPVIVENKVHVRATFHPARQDVQYEIVIHPKMSFGTGHHDTTYLMLKNQFDIDHQGKFVYDFGSGTGILAIMAGLLGAKKIVGNDVDDWCIENANDNLKLNGINAEMHLGTVGELDFTEKAEIVLANINKNILMQEMHEYNRLLLPGGTLLLSGFYEEDVKDLKAAAHKLGLTYRRHEVKNSWTMLVFDKSS